MTCACSRRLIEPPSGHVDDAGVEPERQVLVEPDAQVALALGLLEWQYAPISEPSSAPVPDLGRRGQAQLGVRRLPVLRRDERRDEPGRDVGPDRVLLGLGQAGSAAERAAMAASTAASGWQRCARCARAGPDEARSGRSPACVRTVSNEAGEDRLARLEAGRARRRRAGSSARRSAAGRHGRRVRRAGRGRRTPPSPSTIESSSRDPGGQLGHDDRSVIAKATSIRSEVRVDRASFAVGRRRRRGWDPSSRARRSR